MVPHVADARAMWGKLQGCGSMDAAVPLAPAVRYFLADDESDSRSTASGGGSLSSASRANSSALSEVMRQVEVYAAPVLSSTAGRAAGIVAEAGTTPGEEIKALHRLIGEEVRALLSPPPDEAPSRTADEEVVVPDCREVRQAAVERQLLADACRSHYVIEGEGFCFEHKAPESAEMEGCESSDRSRSLFASRLLAAVEDCIGSATNDSIPQGFSHVVMLLLTQIGLALAHAACTGPTLALCGGHRRVKYELWRKGSGRWLIRAESCAHGFFLYHSGEGSDTVDGTDSGGPQPCSTASSVHRGFSVVLSLPTEAESESDNGLDIEVTEVFEEVAIFSTDGVPVSLGRAPKRRTRPSHGNQQMNPAGLLPKIEGMLRGWIMWEPRWLATRCASMEHPEGILIVEQA